jgi:hypothetical protein
VATPQREAQKPVNREEARMLVATLGYEEAAQRTGIKAGTLRQWARRFNWNQPIVHSQTKAVTTVTKPADALRESLSDDSKATRIGFSRAARKVATHLQEQAAEQLTMPATAISASKWHGIASGVHQWQEKAETGINLNILSIGGDMAVQVNEK